MTPLQKAKNTKKFHNCRFFLVSRSRIGVRDDVFSPGQAVIPAQSLSLAKAGAGIHKKGIYFAVDSRRRGACPREGGEIACPPLPREPAPVTTGGKLWRRPGTVS